MSEHHEQSTDLVETETEVIETTPSEQILAPLELSDYSQFLYETNYGGVKGKDFTAAQQEYGDSEGWADLTWQ